MRAKEEIQQSRFFEWLARSVSPAQLSEMYQAFIDLEAVLSANRYLHHLTQPLIETEDADAIDRLYGDLSTNRQFMRSWRSELKLSLLLSYARYCRECLPAAAGEPRREAVSSGDALIDRLKKDGIAYVDNRPKDGALWIAQSPQTAALIQAARAHGVKFAFSTAKQQWWTRDPSPASLGEPEVLRPEVVERNQSAFLEWLRNQGLDAVDIYAIYDAAGKVHALLLDAGIVPGLFGTCEMDRLRANIDAAKRKAAFAQGDRSANRLWTKATQCYLQFAETEQFAATPTPAKPASLKPKLAPEAAGKAAKTAQPGGEERTAEQAQRAEPWQFAATLTPATPASLESAFAPAAEKAVEPVQPGGEERTAGLVQEDCFRQWLEQNAPGEQAGQMVDVIHGAEQFARRNHLHGMKMFGVAPSAMRKAVRRLSASNAFIKSDRRRYQQFKRAAALLIEYGASLNDPVDGNPAREAAQSAAPTPVQTDGNPGQAAVLEPSLQALLQGERLSLLRDALMQNGIRTLEAFKQRNLWVFMNQNGLYSVGERQAICSDLRRAMASEVTSGARWKIVTRYSKYTGSSPAGALADYCRFLAGKYPLRFRGLIGQRMARSEAVPLSRARLDVRDIRLDNPEAYISGGIDEGSALAFAYWLAEMCRDSDVPMRVVSDAPAEAVSPAGGGEAGSFERRKIAEVEPVHAQAELPKPVKPPRPAEPPEAPGAAAQSAVFSRLQRQVERLVHDADLPGMTLEQLCAQIPGTTKAALQRMRDAAANLVEIDGRLIHKDAFVGWDEAAQKLEAIVDKLMSRNSGYISAAQLYEYARMEMSMFLNDNDLDDQQRVYDLAQHLFEKEGYHGRRYAFGMKSHISRSGETLATSLDVVKKFARDCNGFFRFDDLVAYLERVGVRTGNLRGQMQLGLKPMFFYYSDEEIISAESMRMDEAWLAQASKAFQRLFADVGDHIVLRAINPIWYEQLPTLPGYKPWTPLLLQCVLQFYGKQLGAETIRAELNQKYNVLHAMLVTPDGEIQTFADAVVAHLIDSGVAERQFEAEELRRRLVEGGLIAGNELIWNMPRAIGSDPRFAWDSSGERVNIRV